jgi:hypothetical protein
MDPDHSKEFVYRCYDNHIDAERHFLELSSTIFAKALFSPQGKLLRAETMDGGEDDGWETALALYYEFAHRQGLLTKTLHKEEAIEATPLLKVEPEPAP